MSSSPRVSASNVQTCDAKFKYVCEQKNKLDAMKPVIADFLNRDTFIARYVAYENLANKVINTARSDTLSDIPNPNYSIYTDLMNQHETLKNEVSKKIHENSVLMTDMDNNINRSKKVLGTVSANMDSLSDRAEGSHQSYKNEVGLYRREIFSNFVFLGMGTGVYYLAYKILSESVS
jgi:hypothetical protein